MFKLLDHQTIHICVKDETDRGKCENIMLNVGGFHFQGRDGIIIIISSISNYY